MGSILDAGRGEEQSEKCTLLRGRLHSVSAGVTCGEARGVSRVQASGEDRGHHGRMLSTKFMWRICFLGEMSAVAE